MVDPFGSAANMKGTTKHKFNGINFRKSAKKRRIALATGRR
jgi:hypothetical protein